MGCERVYVCVGVGLVVGKIEHHHTASFVNRRPRSMGDCCWLPPSSGGVGAGARVSDRAASSIRNFGATSGAKLARAKRSTGRYCTREEIAVF